MKRPIYLLTLTLAVLLGFALAVGSTIRQGFLTSFVDAQSSFIQPLTAPVSGNFSAVNFNTGSGVTTTQTNNSSPVTSITLLQSDPNNTENIAALVKNKVASTFTVTIGYTAQQISTGGAVSAVGGIGGLFLYDGSGSNFISFGTNFGLNGSPVTAIGFQGVFFTNFTAGGASLLFQNPSGTGNVGPLAWVRVKETASNRIYYTSTDGINFAQWFSESNTAHFTTTQYGFYAVNAGGAGGVQITVYSFVETTP